MNHSRIIVKPKKVDVPTQTGAVGILPIHVPTLGCLAPGVMNVYTAEGTQSFFVSSGSYTVNNDSTVSIIAEEACKLSDLDKEAATKALAAAQVINSEPNANCNVIII